MNIKIKITSIQATQVIHKLRASNRKKLIPAKPVTGSLYQGELFSISVSEMSLWYVTFSGLLDIVHGSVPHHLEYHSSENLLGYGGRHCYQILIQWHSGTQSPLSSLCPF